jgi:hypothetical protein
MALRNLGFEAYGIDGSDCALGESDPGVRPYLRWMNVQDLAPEERYDLIQINGVLVCLTVGEITGALRRVHEIAGVGLLVEQPTRERILARYERVDVSAIDPLRKQEISQGEWDLLIAEAGFERDTTYYRKNGGALSAPAVMAAASG